MEKFNHCRYRMTQFPCPSISENASRTLNKFLYPPLTTAATNLNLCLHKSCISAATQSLVFGRLNNPLQYHQLEISSKVYVNLFCRDREINKFGIS